ncbi:hypothetical protein Taro_046691 [Colocasia esculenta]|uniref:AAA+ ATPase domain-containing protein n=1 Tax=Colocasia esculenta TaxID=4460 RepID=A0A843WZD9_COLES|nr:hypothetical protein [Colocasia esculenta]
MDLIVDSITSCLKGMLESSLGCLRNLAAERVVNLLNLEENADTLDREMEVVLQTRDDLITKILSLELKPRMKRSHRAKEWLESVQALEEKARALRDPLARRSTVPERCSCDSLHSDWVLGEEVAVLLKRLVEIKAQRGELDLQLVDEAPPDPVVPIPRMSPWVVGGEKTLSAIRGYIRDESVGIIGIYGMGGIGKTTLLAEINNQFLAEGKTDDFDAVIFVTISKEVNISKIQEHISLRLGLSFDEDEDEAGWPLPGNRDDRRDTLMKALGQRKFLLLLDDLWRKLDLESIGIPLPDTLNMRSDQKIVFTTRFEEVCVDMGAQRSKVRVDLLDEKDSWELFSSKLDTRVDLDNDLEIKPLAKQVVGKCGGLPLALITVGKAMSNATGAGEGFLDAQVPESGSLLEAREKGESIIRRLRDACLLESGEDEDEVKMHDVVREMALWLTSQELGRDERSIVCGEKGLIRLEEVGMWTDAKRISIMQDDFHGFPSPESDCSNLSTMLLSGKFLDLHMKLCIPPSLFGSMPVLRVLDLSGTSIEGLPDTVCLLGELRYLNLSLTSLKELPKGLGKLVKLRKLDLRYTEELLMIPQEAILTLGSLQTLDLHDSAYMWDTGEGGIITFKDLEKHLGRLEELSVNICSLSCLVTMSNLVRLQTCIREIKFQEMEDLTSDHLSEALERLENLEVLWIDGCHELQMLKVHYSSQLGSLRKLVLRSLGKLEDVMGVMMSTQRRGRGGVGSSVLYPPLFPMLRDLDISYCHQLSNLSWAGQLPCLDWLYLSRCKRMEELLQNDGQGDGSHESPFPKLRRMALLHLPALRSISRRALLFPSLKFLWVTSCPQLKGLPLGNDGLGNITKIEAEAGWWDALEWDDSDDNGVSRTKAALAPFFVPRPESEPSTSEDES